MILSASRSLTCAHSHLICLTFLDALVRAVFLWAWFVFPVHAEGLLSPVFLKVTWVFRMAQPHLRVIGSIPLMHFLPRRSDGGPSADASHPFWKGAESNSGARPSSLSQRTHRPYAIRWGDAAGNVLCRGGGLFGWVEPFTHFMTWALGPSWRLAGQRILLSLRMRTERRPPPHWATIQRSHGTLPHEAT